jgi:hypothetical protein
VRAKQRNSGPHPRPPVPDAVYRLHPWRRVLLPQGERTQGIPGCALFTVLLNILQDLTPQCQGRLGSGRLLCGFRFQELTRLKGLDNQFSYYPGDGSVVFPGQGAKNVVVSGSTRTESTTSFDHQRLERKINLSPFS